MRTAALLLLVLLLSGFGTAQQSCDPSQVGIYADGVKNEGERLNRDLERCTSTASGYEWWDQDYSQDVCRDGKWVSSPEVSASPEAFTGGINDTQIGSNGFCLGDDASEYEVNQRCVSSYCPTNFSYFGAAKSEDACVLNGSTAPVGFTDTELRQTGDTVELNVPGNRNLTCIEGRWFSEFPATFGENEIEVVSGRDRTVDLTVVNRWESSRPFTLTMLRTEVGRYVEFEGALRQVEIELAGGEVRDIPVNILGGPSSLSKGNISVQVNSSGEEIGVANLTVDTVSSAGTVQPRRLPGIGLFQWLALLLAGAAAYISLSG